MDDAERWACRPPQHEFIEWHLSFFTEAYLPSQSAALSRRLRELGWSESRSLASVPSDPVLPLRTGSLGGGWTNLRTLLGSAPTFDPFSHSRVEQLPDGVTSIRLWLWSVTPSLTVLIVGAEWDVYAGDALDRIAKTDYETAAVPSGNGHQMFTPAFRKRFEAGRRRRLMHQQLASWLAERVPGAFTDLGEPLPFLDVVTAALARPFGEGAVPEKMWDYRDMLGLMRQGATGTSPTLPGWTLALPDHDEPEVLTLGARTADVFTHSLLGRFGGQESRWGLEYYLSGRVDGLLCGWTTLRLLQAFEKYLALTRDRAPASDESLSDFAERLARDEIDVLRHGADAATLCADIKSWPSDLGPALLFRNLDCKISYGHKQARESLRSIWEWQLDQRVARVARLEHDQRERLSTVAELSGGRSESPRSVAHPVSDDRLGDPHRRYNWPRRRAAYVGSQHESRKGRRGSIAWSLGLVLCFHIRELRVSPPNQSCRALRLPAPVAPRTSCSPVRASWRLAVQPLMGESVNRRAP